MLNAVRPGVIQLDVASPLILERVGARCAYWKGSGDDRARRERGETDTIRAKHGESP
jgi:hypothetical protein